MDIKKLKPVFEVPAMPIDAVLFKSRPMPAHCKVERRVMYNLCLHMYANGFRIHSVYDGEVTTKKRFVNAEQDAAIVAALDLVFNLDEASLRFIANDPPNADAWHGVLYVGGNGTDCIADWNYFDDDRDSFNAIMDEFDTDAMA